MKKASNRISVNRLYEALSLFNVTLPEYFETTEFIGAYFKTLNSNASTLQSSDCDPIKNIAGQLASIDTDLLKTVGKIQALSPKKRRQLNAILKLIAQDDD